MDEIAAIRAFAPTGGEPQHSSRDAARRDLEARFELARGNSSSHRAHPRRRGLLALASGFALAAAAAILLFVIGASRSPQPAYGAQLVRFAQSTPLLLLEHDGWEVRNMSQGPEGNGKIEFGPEGGAPAEAHISTHGSQPGEPIPGLRKVELTWAPLNAAMKQVLAAPDDHGFTATLPVLGTTAEVNPGTPSSFPGAHQFRSIYGIWREGDRAVILAAWVKDLGTFGETLSWLRRVDPEMWLEAMPPSVVKAAQYGTEIDAMLKGVPLPRGFQPSSIPNLHLTTSRYSVGKAVGGAVACAWFGHWFQADANQDHADAQKARRALLGSGTWPVFRQIAKEGPYPALVISFAKALPSGRYGHDRPLRGIVSRSCTSLGSPIPSYGNSA